jgi:hypothetical protein
MCAYRPHLQLQGREGCFQLCTVPKAQTQYALECYKRGDRNKYHRVSALHLVLSSTNQIMCPHTISSSRKDNCLANPIKRRTPKSCQVDRRMPPSVKSSSMTEAVKKNRGPESAS